MLEPPVKPIEWCSDSVRIIDQTKLPQKEEYVELKSAREVAQAIKMMNLRGAPLIGIAAAMGVALEARRLEHLDWQDFASRVEDAIRVLQATRPTASNLFWALERMKRVLSQFNQQSPGACTESLIGEAMRIYREDLEMGRKIGEAGADLLKNDCTVLTHCNAGGLATSGFGTALAPIYVAHARGVKLRVFADETRPLLQGARLTAWELMRAGIDVTVICDSAAHGLLRSGRIDIVIVGADRITRTGDFANKVGTYGIALSAREAGVPFYVAAPSSTIDPAISSGNEIPIEERSPTEVTHFGECVVAPEGVKAYNPAFDVTPHELVTGFITEQGVTQDIATLL